MKDSKLTTNPTGLSTNLLTHIRIFYISHVTFFIGNFRGRLSVKDSILRSANNAKQKETAYKIYLIAFCHLLAFCSRFTTFLIEITSNFCFCVESFDIEMISYDKFINESKDLSLEKRLACFSIYSLVNESFVLASHTAAFLVENTIYISSSILQENSSTGLLQHVWVMYA